MDLCIDYACPECRRFKSVELHYIAPGRRLYCDSCAAQLVLTEDALRNFTRDLDSICRGATSLPTGEA